MGLPLVLVSILRPQSFQDKSPTVADSLHVNSECVLVGLFGFVFDVGFFGVCFFPSE